MLYYVTAIDPVTLAPRYPVAGQEANDPGEAARRFVGATIFPVILPIPGVVGFRTLSGMLVLVRAAETVAPTPAPKAPKGKNMSPRAVRARATRERNKAEAVRQQAEADMQQTLGIEECKRRCEEYRKANGPHVGLLRIGADGQPYEWMSWERMMST